MSARLPAVSLNPDFCTPPRDQTMKKLAPGYRQSRSNSGSPNFCTLPQSHHEEISARLVAFPLNPDFCMQTMKKLAPGYRKSHLIPTSAYCSCRVTMKKFAPCYRQSRSNTGKPDFYIPPLVRFCGGPDKDQCVQDRTDVVSWLSVHLVHLHPVIQATWYSSSTDQLPANWLGNTNPIWPAHLDKTVCDKSKVSCDLDMYLSLAVSLEFECGWSKFFLFRWLW
jgi:hypothetical protein